jgi:hypothetical protein
VHKAVDTYEARQFPDGVSPTDLSRSHLLFLISMATMPESPGGSDITSTVHVRGKQNRFLLTSRPEQTRDERYPDVPLCVKSVGQTAYVFTRTEIDNVTNFDRQVQYHPARAASNVASA